MLVGCDSGKNPVNGESTTAQGPIPKDKMTYRINPKTGDKVSILGYGCMRWPTVTGESAREGEDKIDQEAVNRLVGYAIEHGVNYFDTSPAYCKGHSEEATELRSNGTRETSFLLPQNCLISILPRGVAKSR